MALIYHHGGWVHRLPDPPSGSSIPLEKLEGVWERPVRNRYFAGSKISRSAGEEKIIIGRNGPGTYLKSHIEVDVNQGEKRFVLYRETGTLSSDGAWVLFSPAKVEAFESEPVATEGPDFVQNEDMILPDPNGVDYREEDPGAPLLFYMDAKRSMLVPALYEELGNIYSYGIFEGSTRPYDDVSKIFRVALTKYTEKEYRGHGYRLTSEIPWEH